MDKFLEIHSWLKLTQEENENLKQTERIIHFWTSCLTHLTNVPLLYLAPDRLTAEFYQIHKPKVMPILYTCIINVAIEVERNIFQFILWGSVTRMPKLEVSYFVIHLNFAPSSICSWWISCSASLTGKWWKRYCVHIISFYQVVHDFSVSQYWWCSLGSLD